MDLQEYRAANIGLHGLEDEFKLCHLPFIVVNDVFGAVALEGSSGSGKTTLIKRLGALNKAAGGGQVGVFSADKARYEDFIGCPIPDLENNVMKMYPMPSSVATMETLLIDEINRASYDNQEKWLSLLASREIDSQPVACKYIFAAMNPVSGDTGDQYDGTQPLDKAMGERIMLLIQMPKFSQLAMKDKIKIMTACKNQVHWKPTQKIVELHVEFLKKARHFYEGYKEEATERVAEYICAIEQKLRKETKDTTNIRLEGRRSQFILTNILANHALNKVFYNSASLDQSALQALIRSFPNILWQDSINLKALEMAHDLSKDVLNMETTDRVRMANNFDGIMGPLKEIEKAVTNGQDIESTSKQIIQEWPDLGMDPINHYVYALAAVVGLSPVSGEQVVMKRNEYARLEQVYNKLVSSTAYKEAETVGNFCDDNPGSFPSDYTRPSYIENDTDENSKDMYDDAIRSLRQHFYSAVAIGELDEVVFRHGQDLLDVLHKFADATKIFQNIATVSTPEEAV